MTLPATAATTLLSYEWRRHHVRTGPLAEYVRFTLAQRGRTQEAIALIYRILKYPRLARSVFTNPVSGRLPWVLVWKRVGVDDAELRRVIVALQPFMAGYGQYQAEGALGLLGDPDACARMLALGERFQRARLAAQEPVPPTRGVSHADDAR